MNEQSKGDSPFELRSEHASKLCPGGVSGLAGTLLARWSAHGGLAVGLLLLDEGHTALALAVGVPMYVPFLLWNARRALAQGRALVAEARGEGAIRGTQRPGPP